MENVLFFFKKNKIMKNFIFLFTLLFLFSCNGGNTGTQKELQTNNGLVDSPFFTYRKTFFIKGMQYEAINIHETGFFVINVTKDSLEVEALKKQLQK